MESLTIAILLLMLVGSVVVLWVYLKVKKKTISLIDQVIDKVQVFKPFRDYSREVDYQIGLATYLQGVFQDVKIEEQRESSRPDIVVDKDVCLELKGPTDMPGLKTLPDKAMRYSEHFKYIVIVLFDIQVGKDDLNNYLVLLKKHFPDVYVVVK